MYLKKNKQSSLLPIFGKLLIIALLISSCLDQIDFDRPATIENGIAIQGKLVKGSPNYIRITIRKVFDFAENARLINAKVVDLIDEDGNRLSIDSSRDGVFEMEITDEQMVIDYGKNYSLRIELFDNRVYESEIESIMPVPTPVELKVQKVIKESVNSLGDLVDREFLAFTMDTPLEIAEGSGNVKMLWELESTYRYSDSAESYSSFACRPIRIEDTNKACYISASPTTNFIPIDGPNLSSNFVTDFTLYETSINSIFAEGYYLTVLQQSMTPTAFEYWSQVNKVLSRTGDLFEPPAGKVKTNFSNPNDENDEVFGYFYATEEKAVRVFVSPEFANNPNKFCPAPPSENGQAPSDCCNCLTTTGATTMIPSWWVE